MPTLSSFLGFTLVAPVALAPSTGCTTKTCSAIYTPSVIVTVKDAVSGQDVCDADVKLQNGSNVETLHSLETTASDAGPATCIYSGGVRGGVFTVTVSKPGFKTVTATSPDITLDDCDGPTTQFKPTLTLTAS